MSKIILDLCGGTGSWSKPYRDAGYDVRVITLPRYDLFQTVEREREREKLCSLTGTPNKKKRSTLMKFMAFLPLLLAQCFHSPVQRQELREIFRGLWSW